MPSSPGAALGSCIGCQQRPGLHLPTGRRSREKGCVRETHTVLFPAPLQRQRSPQMPLYPGHTLSAMLRGRSRSGLGVSAGPISSLLDVARGCGISRSDLGPEDGRGLGALAAPPDIAPGPGSDRGKEVEGGGRTASARSCGAATRACPPPPRYEEAQEAAAAATTEEEERAQHPPAPPPAPLDRDVRATCRPAPPGPARRERRQRPRQPEADRGGIGDCGAAGGPGEAGDLAEP